MWWPEQIYDIEVVIFFLMLVSEIIITIFRSLNEKRNNYRNYLLIGNQKKVLCEDY